MLSARTQVDRTEHQRRRILKSFILTTTYGKCNRNSAEEKGVVSKINERNQAT